jgi:metal-responsive CopG/Arc/MetJ family transcriptional regulator
MGRKPIGEKPAELFVLRLPEEITVRVDAYAKHRGIKKRAEAFRELVLLGLSTHYEAETKRVAPKHKRKPV